MCMLRCSSPMGPAAELNSFALKCMMPGSSGNTDRAALCHAPRDRRPAPARRVQEPSLYRVYEALCHGGDSIKALINEHWGDGIMSAIGGRG